MGDPHFISRIRTLAAAAALLLAAVGAPRTAHAEEGELVVTAELANLVVVTPLSEDEADIVRNIILVGGQARYAFTDFWVVSGTLRGGVGFLDTPPPEGVFQALAEVHFIVDALTWVPYLFGGVGLLVRTVGPGAYGPDGGTGPAFDFSIQGGLGADWRPEREWSLGAAFRFYYVPTDPSKEAGPTDGPYEITLNFSWYFD